MNWIEKKLQSGDDSSTSSDQLLIIFDMEKFSFKIDCFYCGRKFELNHKFTDMNPLQYVDIMDTFFFQKQYGYVNLETVCSFQLSRDGYRVSMIWFQWKADTTRVTDPVSKSSIWVSLKNNISFHFKYRRFRKRVQAFRRQNGAVHCEKVLEHNV